MSCINTKYNINLETDSYDNQSPMCGLYDRVKDIFNFYPDELLQYFKDVTIHLTENRRPICGAFLGVGIQMSTGFMEQVWCSSYLDVALAMQYPLLNPKLDIENHKSVEIKWDKAMAACYEYIVAYSNRSGWPADLPKPIADYDFSEDASIKDLTTEIFLYQLAIVFLHEVKHVYNKRKNMYQDDARADEIDADDFSVNAFMGLELHTSEIINKKVNFFNKRMLALLELGSYYTSCGILSTEQDDEHPVSLARIESYITAVSGALDVRQENDYDYGSDRYDIRPVIGQASYMLHNKIQYLVLPAANLEFIKCWDVVSAVYDSPWYLYFAAKHCLCEYIDYKKLYYQLTHIDLHRSIKNATHEQFKICV